MKYLAVSLLALSLGACAGVPVPRPQTHVMHHKAVAIEPAPVQVPAVAAPEAKPTFKDRWHNFRQKHPVKWFH